MTFAKKMLMLVLIVVIFSPILGCDVGTTPAESRRCAARVIDYDARMFVDDITLFSQLDRPFRNSRWVID